MRSTAAGSAIYTTNMAMPAANIATVVIATTVHPRRGLGWPCISFLSEAMNRIELDMRNIDVGIGVFFSNMVMFFIILTTAITLNRHGITQIETSRQAAEALRPLAGKFAATLFTVGIVGVGFLAIPTLAGSAAYAFAETFGWHQGLDKKLKRARAFYALILLSTGVGVGLNFAGINPVIALYWTPSSTDYWLLSFPLQFECCSSPLSKRTLTCRLLLFNFSTCLPEKQIWTDRSTENRDYR